MNWDSYTYSYFKVYRSTNGSHYSLYDTAYTPNYLDSSLVHGTTHYYYVVRVTSLGESDHSNIVSIMSIGIIDNPEIPAEYSLCQNYPNPFNPSTTISFGLKTDSKVNLKIYDVLGREIKTLINKNMSAGKYIEIFNASNIATGVYIYKLTAEGIDGSSFMDIKKMMLLK